MKMVKFGNIINVEKGIIVHGVNCMGVMGSGVAVEIKNKWPDAFNTYLKTVKSFDDKRDCLGVVDICNVETDLWVANAFTQVNFGRTGKHVNYEAISTCFKTIIKIATNYHTSIHYPKIGSGLGGGDWSLISEIIDAEFDAFPELERTLWLNET